jgi:hypothetical protein
MAQSAVVLADFHQPVIGVAGYYAPIDNYQHVIAATRDNVVTEIWWRPDPKNYVHGQAELARFGSPIVAIAGYYADVDKCEHVIVADQSNTVAEIRWRPDPKNYVHDQRELARFGSPIVAIAGYYSESDKYEHVIVATADRVVTEVWWKPGQGVGQTQLDRYDAPIIAVAGLDGRGLEAYSLLDCRSRCRRSGT